MKRKLLPFLFMVFIPITMMAFDCEINIGSMDDPYILYFNLNPSTKTAILTYSSYDQYVGDVIIPKTFQYSGQTYTVTEIGEEAFMGCVELGAVTIPNSVRYIRKNAFRESSLSAVTIPSSVTLIASGAFCCTNLSSVTIPNSVTTIGKEAFSQNGLESVTIPGSVTTIGEEAFSFSYDLETVVISEGVSTIQAGAFANCENLKSINIPSSVTSIGADAFTCSYDLTASYSLSSITVAQGNTVYDSRGNCNAIIETATNKLLFGCSSTVIPETVTSIGDGAFTCCRIKEVVIPKSVTSVGEEAFFSCLKLSSVTFEGFSVTVGNYAFFDVGLDVRCDIYVPYHFPTNDFLINDDGDWEWKGGTFYWFYQFPYDVEVNGVYYLLDETSKTATVTSNNGEYDEYEPSYSGEVVIPKSFKYNADTYTVTKIMNNAFQWCGNLTSVTIPSTVTDIDSYAFVQAGLTSLYILGNNVTIGEYAFDDIGQYETCQLYVPNDFDFGDIDTSGDSFSWYGGTFTLAVQKISISAAGVATYCSNCDLDFSKMTEIKAYIATGYNRSTGNVIMQQVTDVPAGTGIFIKGSEGDYNAPLGSSDSYYVNMLKGSIVPVTIGATDGEFSNFLLTADSSFKPVGNNGFNLQANRAYLQIPTSFISGAAANSIGIEFEDGTTGIEPSLSVTGDSNWYSLDGSRLNGKPTQKGIYVVNGKKVVIK